MQPLRAGGDRPAAPLENAGRIGDLNDRSREIFRHIVESYLETGEPVGSRNLSRHLPMTLSPASVRNVMSDLEQLGLIYAPHTSAGRLPTEVGLRLFVDAMMQVAEPTAEERLTIESRLAQPGPIEAALTATSTLLSELSAAAGVVMVPRREPRLAQLQLVPLSATRALTVLVGSDGGIENRVIDLPGGIDLQQMPAPQRFLLRPVLVSVIAAERGEEIPFRVAHQSAGPVVIVVGQAPPGGNDLH